MIKLDMAFCHDGEKKVFEDHVSELKKKYGVDVDYIEEGFIASNFKDEISANKFNHEVNRILDDMSNY